MAIRTVRLNWANNNLGAYILRKVIFLVLGGASVKCVPSFSTGGITNNVKTAKKCTEVLRIMFCRDTHRKPLLNSRKCGRGQDPHLY